MGTVHFHIPCHDNGFADATGDALFGSSQDYLAVRLVGTVEVVGALGARPAAALCICLVKPSESFFQKFHVFTSLPRTSWITDGMVMRYSRWCEPEKHVRDVSLDVTGCSQKLNLGCSSMQSRRCRASLGHKGVLYHPLRPRLSGDHHQHCTPNQYDGYWSHQHTCQVQGHLLQRIGPINLEVVCICWQW